MSAGASAVFEIPTAGAAALRCAECAARACAALRDVPGVRAVDCDPRAGVVRVDFDASRVSESDLEAALARFGLESGEAYRHTAWRITGLD